MFVARHLDEDIGSILPPSLRLVVVLSDLFVYDLFFSVLSLSLLK